MVLHGGPGLDHHEFADYLDPLSDTFRLLLVDMRSQGRSDPAPLETWTLEQMASDISALAHALNLNHYAVLGHSYGAFVALQHAVDFPGAASQSIISSGIPATHFLNEAEEQLQAFEPADLRDQIIASMEHERSAQTPEEMASIVHDQLPFDFADPRDPRIADYEARSAGMIYSPDVLRHFALEEYGGINVEDRLDLVTQPVLVLTGRHDRICSVRAAQVIADGIPTSALVIFEQSGHMAFAEEQDRYLTAVRTFLDHYTASG